MTALRAALDARLAHLRAELATGRSQLAHLQSVLPRIEGAVQVLEELLAAPPPADPSADGAAYEEILCPNPNAAVPTSAP
jgi:hypothetical protein